MPDDPLLKVLPGAEMIDDLPCQYVFHEGIDGEIPSHGGLFGADKRIHFHFEVSVASSDGMLAPWHSDVKIKAFKRIYAETLAEAQGLAYAL